MNIRFDPMHTSGKLLLSIVQEGMGESLVAATREGGAQGSTIILADGVAESSVLRLLGIGDSKKEIVLTIIPLPLVEPVVGALKNFRRNKRLSCGKTLLIDVTHILHHNNGNSSLGEKSTHPSFKNGHTLVTCIVNKGSAEDVMEAAKKAGATGGTILPARGTGKEEDQKFFGFHLVPEKEILLIIVDSHIAISILDVIRDVSCLSKPGSGIAFCIDVASLVHLAKALPVT